MDIRQVLGGFIAGVVLTACVSVVVFASTSKQIVPNDESVSTGITQEKTQEPAEQFSVMDSFAPLRAVGATATPQSSTTRESVVKEEEGTTTNAFSVEEVYAPFFEKKSEESAPSGQNETLEIPQEESDPATQSDLQ